MVSRFTVYLALVFALGLAGCSSMGGGAPSGQAQVVVTGVVQNQIEAKAEEVFYRHGFEFRGADGGHMVFERKGGWADEMLYGNWDGSNTYTRVTLFILPQGAMTYALRTRSEVERRVFGGDEDANNFDIQGGRYGAILRKIKKELEEENRG